MADQTFAVHCGFFDAINSDRTYSADEMNRPYKRVISNGVFATPNGTPSTDLQVTASSGMNIICKKGEGLFGDKWFENPSGIAITVPSNTGTVPRIDSVIVQVDTRTSGRVGNIVHRTGTPASSPVPPAINQVEGVKEYRLANIRVNAGVSAITQSMITDRRGSSDCPWVTSLIYQVDTSTLYDQWQAAYAEYFEEEKAVWDAWYAQLTEDLDVSMTLDRHVNTVTTTAQTTGTIPIGLAYNHNTDILEVYINGLRAIEGTHYVVVDGDTSIQVENQLDIGQTVTFVVMRSVISGSATNIMVLLQDLESQIAGVAGGTPTVVDSTSAMTDTEKIYILSTDGKWYYYSATAEDWVIGGTYGGIPTDSTLTQEDMPADAKAVGDAIDALDGRVTQTDDDVSALDDRVTALESEGGDDSDSPFDAIKTAYIYPVYSSGAINNDGTINTDGIGNVTEYLPVIAEETITLSSNLVTKIAYYTSAKVFISLTSTTTGLHDYTVPNSAAFVRFQCGYQRSQKPLMIRRKTEPKNEGLFDLIFSPIKSNPSINISGDSNTYGYGLADRTNEAWSYLIANELSTITEMSFSPESKWVEALGVLDYSQSYNCMTYAQLSIWTDATSVTLSYGNSYSGKWTWFIDDVQSGEEGTTVTTLSLDGQHHKVTVKFTSGQVTGPLLTIPKTITVVNSATNGVGPANFQWEEGHDWLIVMIGTNGRNRTWCELGTKLYEYYGKGTFIIPFPNHKTDSSYTYSEMLTYGSLKNIFENIGFDVMNLSEIAGNLFYDNTAYQSDLIHFNALGHRYIANAVSGKIGIPLYLKTL